MKVGGVTVTGPTEEYLVLPRDPAPIVFRALAIKNMDEFFTLCPEPKTPTKLVKNVWVPDPDAPGYKQMLDSHNNYRLAYMVIKTLEPSQIEWDNVSPDNPSTWSNWEKELKDGGLTQIEIQRVVQLVLDANALNEDKLEKARANFQLGQAQAQNESSGHPTEPVTT